MGNDNISVFVSCLMSWGPGGGRFLLMQISISQKDDFFQVFLPCEVQQMFSCLGYRDP